jgi:hypothetical protein
MTAHHNPLPRDLKSAVCLTILIEMIIMFSGRKIKKKTFLVATKGSPVCSLTTYRQNVMCFI